MKLKPPMSLNLPIHNPQFSTLLTLKIKLRKLKLRPPMGMNLAIHNPQVPICGARLKLKIQNQLQLMNLMLKPPMSIMMNLPIHTPQFPAIFKVLLILQIKNQLQLIRNLKLNPPSTYMSLPIYQLSLNHHPPIHSHTRKTKICRHRS